MSGKLQVKISSNEEMEHEVHHLITSELMLQNKELSFYISSGYVTPF